MLKATVSKGDVEMHAEGDIAELTADVLTMVHSLFHHLYHDDIFSAILFRDAIEHHFDDVFILNSEEVRSNE